MVPNPRKVFNTPSTDHNNRMLLKVMTNTGDISCNFHTIGQSDTSHFSQGRVRLLGSRGVNPNTNASFLRARLQCSTRTFSHRGFTPRSNQLINCRQRKYLQKRQPIDFKSPTGKQTTSFNGSEFYKNRTWKAGNSITDLDGVKVKIRLKNFTLLHREWGLLGFYLLLLLGYFRFLNSNPSICPTPSSCGN